MSYAHRETLRKMSDETVAKAMNLAAAADDPVAAVIAALN